MSRCAACGGILGRDCYNEADCLQISASNQYNDNREDLLIILSESRFAIEWLLENCQLKESSRNLHSDFFNIPQNVLLQIDGVIPSPSRDELLARMIHDPNDQLPF